GYGAARYGDGRRIIPPAVMTAYQEADHGVDEIRTKIAGLAAGAAHRFVASPDVFTLHGVTGAMAVHLLAGHVPAPAAIAALARLERSIPNLFSEDESGLEPVGLQPPAEPGSLDG